MGKRKDKQMQDRAATATDGASGPGRPWTAEEMRTAVPLPMPIVDDADTPAGKPHAGEGQTAAGGAPQAKPV